MRDIERAIRVLENERACCDRNCIREECGCCDLVMDADWLKGGLDDAIALLKEQKNIITDLLDQRTRSVEWAEEEHKCKNCKWFGELTQDGITIDDWCLNKQGKVAMLWSCEKWEKNAWHYNRDILNGVKEQPTINPQEPVKPVLKGQIYYCSGCNCYGLGIKRDGFGYKFCPGCGRPVDWT